MAVPEKQEHAFNLEVDAESTGDERQEKPEMVISENNAKATISVGLAALLQAAVAIITVAITLAIWGHDVKLLKEVLRDQVIEDAQFRIELLKKIDDMNIRTVKLELSLEYMKEELLSNSQKIAQDNRTKAANKR